MKGKLELRYLPGFAEFIKNEKLVEYVKVQLRYGRELKLPLLRFFEKMSEEQIIELSVASQAEFLDAVINRNIKEHFETSQAKWVTNQLELIDKYDVMSDDIPLISYIRKKAMLTFLPEYTADLADAVSIINEIDTLNLEADRLSIETYSKILREKLNEHSHFIERITETSPGIIYVFDLLDNKEIYANKMMSQLLGYEPEDWKELKHDFVSTLIHPDDIPVIEANQKAIAAAADGEIKSIQYRIKNKSGSYRWMRTYESVFKRTEDGIPRQAIGIALDISNEKRTADQLEQLIQKLQRSEEINNKAQALTHLGNWAWNPETNEVEWSDEMYRIYGLEVGLPIDRDFLRSFQHPEDASRVQAIVEAAHLDRQPFDVYYRIILKDGTVKTLHAIGEVLEDANGKLYRTYGTVQDVSEKEALIHQLKNGEILYQQAQSLSHMGNWRWNMETEELEWSDEMYRIYGLEPQSEKITLDRFKNFIHPDDREFIEKSIESRNEKQKYDDVFKIITNKGEVKVIHSIAEIQFDDKGKPIFLIGTEQDVTEKEQLIKELTNSRELYKQALEASKIGNWTWDVENDIVEWDEQTYRNWEISPGDVAELNLEFYLQHIPEEEREKVREVIYRCFEKHEPYNITHRLLLANGKLKYLQAKGNVILNEEGKVIRMTGSGQDVTERELLIDRLQQSESFLSRKNIELEQSNSNLEEFAYVASHDLQEPLRKISIFSDRLLINHSQNIDKDGLIFLQKIADSSRRMQGMINDLLSVSLISGDKSFERYSLRSVLNDVLQTLEFKIEARNAKVVADDLPEAHVIPSQMRQLFQNLISNSLKFISADRTPEITITHHLLKYAELAQYNLSPRKQYVRIEFIDNGIGFENQYASRIFNIFQRLHGKSEYEGTGIGLAICKKIIENHSGLIFAEGHPGKGATFVVILPL